MKFALRYDEPTRYTVYFAAALDKVKIGCSVRPIERILQVGEWVPFPITMLATVKGGYALESTFHRMFAEEWSHGEWFHASPRLLALIERIANQQPVEIEDRALSEADNARRKAIADKKRLSRKRHLLSADTLAEIDAVPPGQAIPVALLERALAEALS